MGVWAGRACGLEGRVGWKGVWVGRVYGSEGTLSPYHFKNQNKDLLSLSLSESPALTHPASTFRSPPICQRDATLAALDAHLLSRTQVLVGKFSSGLFRVAYGLASARRGALLPFLSLDAPWCADYGVPAGYNDEFPHRRGSPLESYEQVVFGGLPFSASAEEVTHASQAPNLNSMSNVFLC